MSKYVYEIRWYTQVLKRGAWGSPDCEWDWGIDTLRTASKREAMRRFKQQSPTNDTPIIRLYQIELDDEGVWVDSKLLEELS